MAEYTTATFGDRLADVYDEWSRLPDTDVTVQFLADLAGSGPVLELGIGTGRVALPLAARGVEVHGIDASRPMVDKLRAKPGGDKIPVSIGDFADCDIPGSYSLIYVVDSSFCLLSSQEVQCRCLANIAQHLDETGALVVQTVNPDPVRLSRGERVATRQLDTDRVFLELARADPSRQRVEAHQVLISERGITLFPMYYRSVWPSELDLMAQLANLHLRARWGGWRREPFTVTSTWHVSVYGRTPVIDILTVGQAAPS